MDLLPILEWSAFGSSLLCAWVYGYRTIAGPVIGILTAILFMLFGWFSGVPAALAANLVFLIVHTRNGLKMLAEDKSRSLDKIAKEVNALTDVIYDVGVAEPSRIQAAMNLLVKETHGASVDAGWWTNIETGESLPINYPLKTVLIHSEISEAMEGHRKGIQDDKLPHRAMFEVELADAVIRAGDLIGKSGANFGKIFIEELEFCTNVWVNRPATYSRLYVSPGSDVQTALCVLHRGATKVFEDADKYGDDSEMPVYALARFLVTVFQTAHITGIDLGGAIAEKMEFNASRPDHKIENRKKGGGKTY